MSWEGPDPQRDEDISHAPLVAEGSDCPTCHRRVPHKRKKTSPLSKPFSFRIAVDDHETFKETLVATAQHMGLYEKPHWQYWTILHGLAVLLQGPAGGED